MNQMKKFTLALSISTVSIVVFAKVATAQDDDLTRLLIASAQVGSTSSVSPPNGQSESLDEQIITENDEKEVLPEETPPEVAKTPINENEQDPSGQPENNSVVDAPQDTEITNTTDVADSVENDVLATEIPAVPAPVALPESTIAVGEPMRKSKTNSNRKRMDAIQALKYLLGDLEKIEKKATNTNSENSQGLGSKYLVKPGDTLDLIIEETMSNVPIRKGILRLRLHSNL